MERMGTPEEVAALVCFLASDAAVRDVFGSATVLLGFGPS
jgi:NAD(P)-dependent dehydrogenase (short-subunit alcohol dehydrogenase family)